ncbi:MAG: UvrD-helicase domain-containing protein [Spirochaetaceae bacterium]|jgi:ATP-dependent helicase/nuclease subunit A|nr:UvrD-helicase domain-containing protein [Spirochaetaceae bacterium]
MSCERILAELDEEQRKAATAVNNVVVSAGAGSGKTKVLAARYAWLVMEQGRRVDEILTLTFTNKAVSEMYSRIYGLLSAERDNERAREAVANFHKAKIATLDSFCAAVARTAARRYGISPDFQSDEKAVRDMALEAALPFLLDHRDNPSLRLLMADRKIKTLAEELFAETALRYSPISSPLDFDVLRENQGRELLSRWGEKTRQMERLVGTIREEMERVSKKDSKLYLALRGVFASPLPAAPDIRPLLEKNGFCPGVAAGLGVVASPGVAAQPGGPTSPGMAAQPGGRGDIAAMPAEEEALRQRISVYFTWLAKLASVNRSGRHGDDFTLIKDSLKEFKEKLCGELESIANMSLQVDIIAAVFPLAAEFQGQFNKQKREAGLLTFNDIARLAVDALKQYPDIRRVYKREIKAIMIDEFQDNNSLQRDLVYLLAEADDRELPGIPLPGALCRNKLFFVGDEKQSIYRFRGADVSVFRSLAESLPAASAGDTLRLPRNYRSAPVLIAAFNRIFGGRSPEAGSGERPEGAPAFPGVFLPASSTSDDFEARYDPVYSPRNIEERDLADPPVHFCFLDTDRLPQNDPRGLSSYDLEAAWIALKIRELVESKYPLQDRRGTGGTRACGYGDIAVLERSYTHQHSLEKQFKDFGIPYNADRPAGLFSDAPVNDLCNFLRLLVYPEDRIAYAALLRSPFMRLSDLALPVCLLNYRGIPFDEAAESQIPPEEQEAYRRGRERYRELAAAARTLPVSALLTKLWYDEGYRYETIWSPGSRIYAELFDLFFELARDTDRRGGTLVDFLDYLAGLINREERLEDLAVPAEREAGVRIMSIHKSKGLEFPVVFVYCCASAGAKDTNTRAVYFNDKWGLTLNLPQAEEIPRDSGNYFFNLQREEEERKRIAELRRLLYVAMTRAESALFLTASLPAQTKEERNIRDLENEVYNDALVRERVGLLNRIRKEDKKIYSFFDLLLPALAGRPEDQPPFFIRHIPVMSRRELAGLCKRSGSASMRAAAEKAAPFYAAAEVVTTPREKPGSVPASSLRYEAPDPAGDPKTAVASAIPANAAPPADAAPSAGLFPEKSGLDAADFGTLVHGFLEALLKGAVPRIPPRILSRLNEKEIPPVRELARSMAEGFLNSELGARSRNAAWREPEFPILSAVRAGGRNTAITGQIDLLFEEGGTIHVVDFKTDRIEEPEHHLAQLAVYARAVGDIFKKPVRSWLFYLRSGRAVELGAGLDKVDIEALVDAL